MNIYITIYKTASGKLLIAQGAQLVLFDDLERWDRWVGRSSRGRGYVYTYGGFTLLYGRN